MSEREYTLDELEQAINYEGEFEDVTEEARMRILVEGLEQLIFRLRGLEK